MRPAVIKPNDRLIVALDVDSEEKAVTLVEKLKNDVRYFKVGFELFSSCGPAIVKRIKETDSEIFLDLKFHDIPNTVSRAGVAAMNMGVFMFNVHAAGGLEMMKKAADVVDEEAHRHGMERPLMIAVTVLTSLDQKALKESGVSGTVKGQVLRLAKLAKKAGLDGVVASPEEIKLIRKNLGEDFLIITPGVRPKWAPANDQKRVATPEEAVKTGADYIVVGRPITGAKDPAYAAREILKEIKR